MSFADPTGIVRQCGLKSREERLIREIDNPACICHLDRRSQVHRARNNRWQAARHGFKQADAEILLVRREYEDGRLGEHATLLMTCEPAGKVDS